MGDETKNDGWEEASIPAPKTVDGVWEEASTAPIKEVPKPSALGVGEATAAAVAVPKGGWEAKKAMFKSAAPGMATQQRVTDVPAMQRYLNSQLQTMGIKGTVPLEKFTEALNVSPDKGYIESHDIQEALKSNRATPNQRIAVETPKGKIWKMTPGNTPVNLQDLAEVSTLERYAPGVASVLKPLSAPLSAAGRFLAAPLAAGAAAGETQDAMNRWDTDKPGAIVSGLGALGSAASVAPFLPPPVRIMGGAMGAAAPAINAGIEAHRAHVQANTTPEQREAVRNALPFHFADGGPVIDPRILAMIRAARITR